MVLDHQDYDQSSHNAKTSAATDFGCGLLQMTNDSMQLTVIINQARDAVSANMSKETFPYRSVLLYFICKTSKIIPRYTPSKHITPNKNLLLICDIKLRKLLKATISKPGMTKLFRN